MKAERMETISQAYASLREPGLTRSRFKGLNVYTRPVKLFRFGCGNALRRKVPFFREGDRPNRSRQLS